MAATDDIRFDDRHRPSETEPERAARLEREAALLEEGRADIRAGLFISDEDVDAWLDRFVAGEDLPIPDAPQPKRAK